MRGRRTSPERDIKKYQIFLGSIYARKWKSKMMSIVYLLFIKIWHWGLYLFLWRWNEGMWGGRGGSEAACEFVSLHKTFFQGRRRWELYERDLRIIIKVAWTSQRIYYICIRTRRLGLNRFTLYELWPSLHVPHFINKVSNLKICMGYECSGFGCTSGYKSRENAGKVNLHRFPTNNPQLIQKCASKLERKGYRPTEYSRTCSLHFASSCFIEVLQGTNKRTKSSDVPLIPGNYVYP